MSQAHALNEGPTALQRAHSVLGRLAVGVGTLVTVVRSCLPNGPSVRGQPGGNDYPRDCVLVIDASPSMDDIDWKPSRLGAAKKAANAYARRLASSEPAARVAIVSYCATSKVRCSLTPVSNSDRLKRSIASIRTNDWTNITAGLEAALRLLQRSTRPCQVVLLSDGHHNHGPKPHKIADTLKQQAIIECVGIGIRQNVDERLLRRIASAHPDRSKRYRWIGDPDKLVRHFHKLAGRITRV